MVVNVRLRENRIRRSCSRPFGRKLLKFSVPILPRFRRDGYQNTDFHIT